MAIFITSDWHLGEEKILKHRPMFKSIAEHDAHLIERYRSVVGSGDTVYFLGDICSSGMSFRLINMLHGRKFLIMGNNDRFKALDYLGAFDDIKGPIKYEGMWLTHQPIHEQELYSKPNIHGHTHDQYVIRDDGHSARGIDPWYFNASPEVNAYCPVNIETITDLFKLRGVLK